jgi:DNA-binding CsgD family transcriptional regulator
VTLTPDAGKRASRALTAARAKFEVGDSAASESLLAVASAGPLDELGHSQVERRYAEIAFDMRRGSDAPLLLLRAAQRFEHLDTDLAQQSYLEALVAAIYAASLAKGTNVVDVARAADSSPAGSEPTAARQQLLRGLASRFIDGYATAAPMLRVAIREHRASEGQLDWTSVAFILAAMELWDDEAWLELASSQAELARATGRLIFLPYALNYLAGFYLQAGELAEATRLLAEAEDLHLGPRAETLPYIPSRLAAWRGDATTALNLFDVMKRGALAWGEGGAISAAEYAAAILYNGLGQYELACEAAERAIAPDDLVISSWAMPELIEAASRCDRRDVAHDAADQLSERAAVTGTNWALGTAAHARALVEVGDAAEKLHREGIELLGNSRVVAQLARAQLCYGEWLRRVNRRADARPQLRLAYDTFASMGAEGFTERARRELLATGEKVRKRRDDTRNELTPQEEHIARLARNGQTNPEIGAELFISARTVEWHLRKVFTKLGITSRKDLLTALPGRD